MKHRAYQWMIKHSVFFTGTILACSIYGAAGKLSTGMFGYFAGVMIVIVASRFMEGR